jgi:hypothetical protein
MGTHDVGAHFAYLAALSEIFADIETSHQFTVCVQLPGLKRVGFRARVRARPRE